jgi:hypothetical protein
VEDPDLRFAVPKLGNTILEFIEYRTAPQGEPYDQANNDVRRWRLPEASCSTACSGYRSFCGACGLDRGEIPCLERLRREEALLQGRAIDHLTIYWATQTIHSSARIYCKSAYDPPPVGNPGYRLASPSSPKT